jgi:NarL family two-component system response regulator LiaR
MSTEKIRVLIADDHVMVRTGLATMLKVFEEMEFVGEASNGQAAVDLCDLLTPDLVLMDMNMPVLDGVTATRAIHTRHPQIKVLALTAYLQDDIVQQALQAGASGYVVKDVSPEELMHAIHAAFAGQFTFSPQAAQSLLHTGRSAHTFGHELTEREQEVLRLMVQGLSNNGIAAHLQVSPATVKSHVSNILAKLDVTTRAEAVALATRNGILP